MRIVFVPVWLQWIDGKTKVVVRSIRESIVDLEPSEDGDKLCLVEGADDGEDELEVLGQHIGLLRPERHLIGKERLRLGDQFFWTESEVRCRGPEIMWRLCFTFQTLFAKDSPIVYLFHFQSIYLHTHLRVLSSSMTPSNKPVPELESDDS